MEDQDFLLFIKSVKDYTRIDLAQYKEAQMKRRLTTLRLKRGYDDFKAYFQAMKQSKEMLNEFLDRMTINVSEFWRNRQRWEVLQKHFVPEMAKQSSRIKCWSAACSTGEEPYTLAMLMDELHLLDRVDIHATDIDDNVLAGAQAGMYLERSFREMTEAEKKTYFRETGGRFAVDAKLKSPIRFKKHNLLLDPYGSDFHLIICRNVLIYFTESAKHEIYQKFAQALRPGGILYVGSTEQIFRADQYGLESTETFFYRKKQG